MAAVEDLALVQHDRLQEPMGADVGDELSELGAVDREQGNRAAAGWCSSSAGRGPAGWSGGGSGVILIPRWGAVAVQRSPFRLAPSSDSAATEQVR
jgi:hypothetical protein